MASHAPPHTPSLRSVHWTGTGSLLTRERLVAAALFAPALTVLLIAAWLTPDPEGLGTHTQIPGLEACAVEVATGLPCASCGMTTTFAHAANGDLVTAFFNQPAGALLAVLTAMTLLVAGYALIAGVSLAPLGRALWRPSVVVLGVTILLLAWTYKISLVLAGA